LTSLTGRAVAIRCEACHIGYSGVSSGGRTFTQSIVLRGNVFVDGTTQNNPGQIFVLYNDTGVGTLAAVRAAAAAAAGAVAASCVRRARADEWPLLSRSFSLSCGDGVPRTSDARASRPGPRPALHIPRRRIAISRTCTTARSLL
jgi:hypothetical protein